MQKEINESIQERIKNEKKQKNITTITAILFCLFAIIIIVLSIRSAEQQKTINSLRIKNDSLQKEKLKSDNLKLIQESAPLERSADSFVILQKAVKEAQVTQEINKILKKTSIQNYTIYIQYMENFSQQSLMLKTAFREEKYTVAKEQNMQKLSFPSSVRYFYKTDKDRAIQISKKAQEVIKKKFKVQYMKLKSPQNQIEIWIGR